MDHARRGYILIAVMVALTLCVTLAGAFAVSSRRALVQARVGVESAQAQYLARGACIHAVRDLSVALHRRGMIARSEVDGAMTGEAPVASRASTRIEGLPEFPAEMAGAGGLLGAIADAMGRVRERQQAASPQQQDGPSPTGPGASERERERDADGDVAAPPIRLGPVLVTIGNTPVEARIESETGKLNVNTARRGTLVSLLVALGEREEHARTIINAIEDYRMRRNLAPGEVLRVVPSRLNEEPLNGSRLDRIEELLAVPGVAGPLYERLLACLTVGEGSVMDPNYMPRPVFMALGVVEPRALERLEEAQRLREPLSRERVRTIVGIAAFRALDEHLADNLLPVFTVRARADVGGSVGRHLIRVGVGDGGVPRVLESREGWL